MTDVRAALRQGPMSGLQIAVVAVCIAVNMIDGFDVLAAAFTAPSLAEAWAIKPQMLGYFLGSGPVGMALGALVLGSLADVFGRRYLVLFCIALMGVGMFLSAGAADLTQLILLRILTGLGIGGALASANTIVAEYSSDRRRALAVSWMTAGYPIGATLGGVAAIWLLQSYDWRMVFAFGGALSVVLLPLIWFFLPESLDFLAAKGTPGALRQANAILARLGRPAIEAFPPQTPAEVAEAGRGGVFGPEMIRATLLLCLAYFFVMLTFYFVLQWTPKVLVDAGLSKEGGVSGGTLMNLGGIIGSLGFGAASAWMAAKRLGSVTMAVCFGVLVVMAFAPVRLGVMLPLGFVAGVFIFAAMASLYALAPVIFPARVRATGTGMGIGIGRVGAILGPIAAGYLIGADWQRWQYTIVLAVPMLLAAAAVARVPLWGEKR